ncbi:DUF1489 family protein [Rhodobacterales bacterium HKCCE3408]|nr:DUF1489 family protein [Rhodobacterales bacterium HKCCE3408]
MGKLHLIKLCVGAESPEDLLAWRAANPSPLGKGLNRHTTRMWPKREDELLDGGSLYWVFRGLVRARQRIVRLDEVIGADGIRRCGIILDAELIRTAPMPKRAFQGWRYLPDADAPRDLDRTRAHEDLPAPLERALADIGVV